MLKKAVFPVGGLGTRFLPVTKSIPKEMLPLVDKPLIHFAVNEAIEAGIEEFIFVTGRGKTAIEDYFDLSYELTANLKNKNKKTVLNILDENRLPPGCFSYTRQQEPLGLGHAIWCARHLVGNEPFAVLLVDDFIHGTPGCLKQMADSFEKVGGNLAAIVEVPENQVSDYGIIQPGSRSGPLVEIKGLVEKPSLKDAPSRLSIVGRYILSPQVFEILENQEKGAGGEIQLTDALDTMIGADPFHGFLFQGKRFDCGNKKGYLAAILHLAAEDPDLKSVLTEFSKNQKEG